MGGWPWVKNLVAFGGATRHSGVSHNSSPARCLGVTLLMALCTPGCIGPPQGAWLHTQETVSQDLGPSDMGWGGVGGGRRLPCRVAASSKGQGNHVDL